MSGTLSDTNSDKRNCLLCFNVVPTLCLQYYYLLSKKRRDVVY